MSETIEFDPSSSLLIRLDDDQIKMIVDQILEELKRREDTTS